MLDVPDRLLRLAGVRNLRDVGGYPAAGGRRVRWRTLYRTDAFDLLPVESQAHLIELGLRTVIDLRWPHELDEAPNVFRSHARLRYRSIPLLDDDPTPRVGLAGTYRHIFDQRGAQLAQVVRELLRDDGTPAVIGCAAGKDRTGVAIALVLEAVGVPRHAIVEDYALSAPIYAGPADVDGLDGWRAASVVVECPPEYMADALEHLERRHGGAAGLLTWHGLTLSDLDQLRERLTEPAG